MTRAHYEKLCERRDAASAEFHRLWELMKATPEYQAALDARIEWNEASMEALFARDQLSPAVRNRLEQERQAKGSMYGKATREMEETHKATP